MRGCVMTGRKGMKIQNPQKRMVPKRKPYYGDINIWGTVVLFGVVSVSTWKL